VLAAVGDDVQLVFPFIRYSVHLPYFTCVGVPRTLGIDVGVSVASGAELAA
jgi:hypothetical protein